jgi:SAM-dependent methyltransferase
VTPEERIRRAQAQPWRAGGKLPWNEPGFSARMLREHLSQAHGGASRRFADVDRHVAWLHEVVLRGRRGRVLDLGCGPGLYTIRLARLGHRCVGLDFSPASIEHAQAEARREGLSCDHELRDLRDGAFGFGFDAALLLFGELHTFDPVDAERVLAAAHRALASGGALVLELHPEAAVRARARRAEAWFSAERGLFCDAPHVGLSEARWDDALHAAVERFLVLPTGSDEVAVYTSTTWAYADDALARRVRAAGFESVEPHPALSEPSLAEPDLLVWVCRA